MDAQGRVFLDQPPEVFKIILDALRIDQFTLPSEDIVLRSNVEKVLDTFGLSDKHPFGQKHVKVPAEPAVAQEAPVIEVIRFSCNWWCF